MSKSKLKLIWVFLLIFLFIICSIYIIKNKNSNLTVIKTFLKQYYTVDEIMTREFDINQEFILQKKDQYKNLIETSYLEKFVNNRTIIRSLLYAEENNCTLSIEKIKVVLIDKLDNETEYYKFNATIIADYENTTKSTEISGKIQVISIGDKSYINYVDLPNLNTTFN